MKRPAALAAFGIILAALAACQVIAGIDRVEKVDGTDMGTSSSSSSSGVDPADPCAHMLPPEPPKKADTNPDLPPFYVAAAELSLTSDKGYDLDLSCTCDHRPGTNHDGGSPCTFPPTADAGAACDPDGGVDNNSAKLFQLLKSFNQDLDSEFRADAEDGKRTILILIKNWNGEPNDFDVTVGIFVSNGANPIQGDGEPSRPPTISDGKSDWSHPSTVSKQGGVFQPTALPNGYVSNGTLVVKNAGTVSIFLGNNGLTFNEALVVGDLKRDAATEITRFDGVVGGRIRATELLAAAGQLRISGETPACTFDKFPFSFNTLKQPICDAVDIAQGSISDFKGLVCDSISSTISLSAFTATVSGDTPVDISEDKDNPCAPDKVAPGLYQCQ